MSTVFCLTVRFLDSVASFHGRGDGGEPEWPPSPLRLFQAIVAASASRWRGSHFADYAHPALQWLETRIPVVVTPGIQANRTGYRMYVPNNATDLVTSAWARGNTEASIAEHRVEKDVRPTRLVGGDSVHYLWDLPEPVPAQVSGYLETLAEAARSITHLGWGVDMVAANASVSSDEGAVKLPGERWRPTRSGGTALRVPIEGTLAALADKHAAFLTRLGPDGFNPVPPLTAFATLDYRRDTDVSPRPFAAFALLTPDADRYRAFDTVRRTPYVAGMVRHEAAKAASLHRPGNASWVNTFVLGHGDGPGQRATTIQRFAYLPIPTIEERGQNGRVVGSIRRVLVVEPPGGTGVEVAWVRQRLSGQYLIDERTGQPAATLSLIPTSDPRLRWYVRPSDVWSTVTPVILPGYDDRDAKKGEQLLRSALSQAGFPPELVRNAQLDWRQVGFLPGVDLALRYCPPAYLKNYPRYHVQVRWLDAAGRPVQVRGPVVIGGGRYCGLGLFAAIE